MEMRMLGRARRGSQPENKIFGRGSLSKRGHAATNVMILRCFDEHEDVGTSRTRTR
jgi:hypothetical protein